MFKKIKIIVIALVVGTLLTACSGGNKNQGGKIDVKVQVWAIQYLVNEIGKENVNATLAVESGDAHHKEPTQKEIADLSKSILFFYIGYGDVGVEAQELLKATNSSADKNIDLASNLEAVAKGSEKDPHVWLSPKQMLIMAETVKQKLSDKLPDKKNELEANYNSLVQRLKDLDAEMKTMFANKNHKKVLVEHSAYAYMARDYGFEQLSLTSKHEHEDHEGEGSKADEHAEISAAQIEDLKKVVATEKLSILYGDSQNQSELTGKVAQELGLKVEKVSTLETLSQEETKKDYITHIKEITEKFSQEME